MTPTAAPPRLARWIAAHVIADPGWRDQLLGDLAEEHGGHHASRGRVAAALWYWWQVALLLADAATRGVARAAGAVRSFLLPGDRPMHALQQECRLAIRMMLRRPLVTAVIVTTLAVSLGANAATFGMVDALLLRPFTFPNADRLVMLSENSPDDVYPKESISPATFADLRGSFPDLFARMAAIVWWDVNLAGGDQPERVQGYRVTADFLPMLGISPAAGRAFTTDDEIWGHQNVVVLGDALWRRRFGADPHVVGRTIRLDGESYAVIGLAPEGFAFPDGAEMWAPMAFSPTDAAARERHYLTMIAELKPGIAVAAAQAPLTAAYDRLKQQHPEANRTRSLIVRTFTAGWVDVGTPQVLGLWQAAAFIVLLIACVNVTSLLLARAAERRRELALRLALGAGGARLVRQMLLESLVVALLSVPAALGVAVAIFRLTKSAMPPMLLRFLPGWDQMGVNGRVGLFTVAAAAGASLVFGLLPAVQSARASLVANLKDGTRGAGAAPARSRLRRGLVIAQIAIAVPLLLVSGLAVMGSDRFAHGPQGYNPSGLLRMRMILPDATYPDDATKRTFVSRLLDAAARVPGVERVATTSVLPSSSMGQSRRLVIDGAPPAAHDDDLPTVNYRSVSSDYLATMQLPLQSGRSLLASDREGTQPVAVVSESLARRFFPDRSAIGQRVKFGSDSTTWITVVGVSGDTIDDWFDSRGTPTIYVAEPQFPNGSVFLVARTSGDPARLADGIRAALASVDSTQPAFEVMPMLEAIRIRTTGLRFIGGLMAAFGVIALGLAAIGIYGVMSHFVAQRRHEIGVRMALGASRADVLRLTARTAIQLAAIGILLGTLAGLALARVMESVLFGLVSVQPGLIMAIVGVMTATSMVASLVPARQAAGVDPALALRAE
ncbi:MAG TPA: ABC transporter permease [Vicinamibacterales bacterium]|nr:ABC transporter permease [Vicinamibacterales bacterium]